MAIFDINDGFSRNRRRPETQEIPDIRELRTDGPGNGYYARFLRPLLPNNALINLQKRPLLSQQARDAIRDAGAINDAINRARQAEDIILINGRQLPGIFQGFSVSGGVITEKFDQGRHRLLIKGIVASGGQLFQVDKGVKPFSGRGRFVLLDDEHSDSLAKSSEFVRIITDWKSGENGQTTGIPRVFKMESFLNGVSPSVPFFFQNIKIVDYGITLGNGMEGRIDAFFSFEQFELLKKEKSRKDTPLTPKSEIKAPNSEKPDVETSEVNEITFAPLTIQGG